VRDWIYVEDHCRGVLAALQRGRPGEKYNLGGRSERTNLQIVDALCEILDSERAAARSYKELKTFVADRPGHDRRYAIDDEKARTELDWEPRQSFESGLRATVRWYIQNRAWCESVQSGKYDRERLGLLT
jgi:dTDP-glucose 4,6-dehydratase